MITRELPLDCIKATKYTAAWKTRPVDIELYPGEKAYPDKPYPVSCAHEDVFRKEV